MPDLRAAGLTAARSRSGAAWRACTSGTRRVLGWPRRAVARGPVARGGVRRRCRRGPESPVRGRAVEPDRVTCRACPTCSFAADRRPVEGIHFRQYRQLHPLDAMKYQGIPVTTVARTLVDLTDILTPDELANVIHEAAVPRAFQSRGDHRAMERANGRKNLKRLEQAISDSLNGSAGTRSRNEREFLKLLEAHGLPKPLVNTHVLGIEVDCHWPDHKLVAEIDGPGHARPRTQREDRAVDAALTSRRLHDRCRGTPRGGPRGAPGWSAQRDLRLSRGQRERQRLGCTCPCAARRSR